MTRFHFGHGILLALLLWTAGLVVLAALSFQSPVELTERDYYSKELRHQEQIDRELNTAALTAPVALHYSGDSALVTLRFPEEIQNSPVRGTLTFFRPDFAALDTTVSFAATASAAVAVPVNKLHPGNWKVKMNWQSNGKAFYQEQSLIVPRKHAKGA
ncbi:MAG: FixH family protein [Chitinophagales bacterium]|nr:FixH family protein [Chitinophagales bacterium]MDW8394441.1 FixH family protein [Chitinophagales bacterium]